MKYVPFVLMLAVLGALNAQEALTNDSILKMVKAGLSEDVVLSMVKSQPAKYALGPDQVITLKSAGVSDKVVAAMVERSAGGNSFGGSMASGATPADFRVIT